MESQLSLIQTSSATINGSSSSVYTTSSSGSGVNDFNARVINGAAATITADMTGSGTVIVGDSSDTYSSTLTLNGIVGSGETVQLNTGTLLLDQPLSFAGSIEWNCHGGTVPAEAILAGMNADSFSFDGTEMSFFQAGLDVLNINIHQDSSYLTAPWSVSQTPQGVVISSLDPGQILGAVPLTHVL